VVAEPTSLAAGVAPAGLLFFRLCAQASDVTARVSGKAGTIRNPFHGSWMDLASVTPTSEDLGGQLVEEIGQVFEIAYPAARP